MQGSDNRRYDAIIIGAGISGLVCGCFLAKAGMKVMIVEKHARPGGYCASFKRRDYSFDAAAHSFGSYREGGIMNSILRTLDVDKKLSIKRYAPTDVIIAPDHQVKFWPDLGRTIYELQQVFPDEAKGVSSFFEFLSTARAFDLAACRAETFEALLNKFFSSAKLKAVLAYPILGVSGLPSSRISAFSALTLYTEFFLDGGYYPQNGMQALPDALAQRFVEFGGELRLSCLATKISVESGIVRGVELEESEFIPSQFVVSCCDVRHTFLQLIGPDVASKELLQKLDSLVPSASVFIAYLGLKDAFPDLAVPGVSTWVMPHYDIESICSASLTGDHAPNPMAFMIHTPPDKRSLEALTLAPYQDKQFWKSRKAVFLEHFVQQIEQIFPGFSSYVAYREAATPQTLNRYTLNYCGSAYGWASTPSQLFTRGLTQATAIRNLYLSGHWTTQTQGISGVAYLGRETAKLVLKKEKSAACNRVHKTELLGVKD